MPDSSLPASTPAAPTETPHSQQPQTADATPVASLPGTPPPGGQSRALHVYPSHLSRGRGMAHVPLHRRGTSGKYEHLEDLLREAGYKETRIFTPETERHPHKWDKDETDGEATGVGAMMRFIGGLFPSRSQSTTDLAGNFAAYATESPSLTAHRAAAKRSERPSPEAPLFASPTKVARPSYAVEKLRASQRPYHTLRPTASSPNISTSLSQKHGSTLKSKHPPLASSSRVRGRSYTKARQTHPPPVPPLPQTWLGTLLSHSASFTAPSPSRSSIVFQGHSSSNGNSNPPPFTIRSSHTSLGLVQQTHVLCRSAPSSRSASKVRLPTLARTRTENDPIASPSSSQTHLPSPSHFLLPSRRNADFLDGSDYEDEEDEEELTFDRLLVPSRRQGSIRSLRKHLYRETTARAALGLDIGGSASHSRPSSRHSQRPARPPWRTQRHNTWSAQPIPRPGSALGSFVDSLNSDDDDEYGTGDDDGHPDWRGSDLPGLKPANLRGRAGAGRISQRGLPSSWRVNHLR